MELLMFLIGFVIGLPICCCVYFYVEDRYQKREWRKFMEYMRKARENVIRNSDGEIIWREDIGLCGKTVTLKTVNSMPS